MIRAQILALSLLAAPAMAKDGPISKFNDHAPDLLIHSTRIVHDIERCLIDMRGIAAPYVYWQPDRPNDYILLWTDDHGLTRRRVDLIGDATGTQVNSWNGLDQVAECAASR